mmetsp:Transcript_43465/g.43989  ORF Transcript_43465/g.43989 Transcript_43465/m.43989 type:complete len:126 (-) Transcript_43465:4-381(-)
MIQLKSATMHKLILGSEGTVSKPRPEATECPRCLDVNAATCRDPFPLFLFAMKDTPSPLKCLGQDQCRSKQFVHAAEHRVVCRLSGAKAETAKKRRMRAPSMLYGRCVAAVSLEVGDDLFGGGLL